MDNRENLFLPLWINGKLLICIFCAMICMHFVAFVIYYERSSSTEFTVNREIISRQIINFIQTMQTTVPSEQEKMVTAMDLPNFKINIDDKPKFELQFVDSSLWQVLKKISEQAPTIQFSFMLEPNRWLNVTANIIHTSWGLQALLFGLEFVVILAILFSLWTIHRFSIPLKKIAGAAERLGVDLDTEPLPIYGPRVAQVTAHAMNKMQQRIRDLVKARTQMLAAISHDLRTPITRLKLRAQYIEDPQQYEKIIKDLDDMESMIAETLAFAREDSNTEKRVNLDLSSLLLALCDDFLELGKNVIYHGTHQRLTIHGSSIALKRVFENLVENALKYAGSAEVNIEETEDEVLVLVDDNGPGIPVDQFKKVFQPFYRGEHSRSRETGGTGLGLAVARDIIQAHGGSIELSLRKPHGLRAMVRLPKIS